MSVLLTGSTGFLGRRVLRDLIDDGLTVRCAVRTGSDLDSLRTFLGESRWPSVETVTVNLNDRPQCRDLVTGCAVVWHVAAGLKGCCSNLFLNTVVPTRELMHAAADRHVPRFVLVSSLGVYGSQQLKPGAVLDESCPIDSAPSARDPYTYSKIVQEEAARAISEERELPLVVVRPGVIYGDERGVLTHRIGLSLGGWMLRMGRQPLPITYVDNCSSAVVAAGLTKGVEGQTFNIVDDELPTSTDVIRRYRQSGRRLKVMPIPRWMVGRLAWFNEKYAELTDSQIPAVLTQHRVQAVWRPLRYSSERAKHALGWEPRVDLRTAFDRSLNQETRR